MLGISKFFLWASLAVLVEYSLATPQTMLDLVNQQRAANNVGPLILDNRLVKTAQQQSDYQASIQQMTHSNSAGDLGQRLLAAGFNFQNAGENVAWNFPDEASVMTGWMNSPGHRANILNPDFTRFGMGMTDLYWTQDFGRLMGESPSSPSSSNSGSSSSDTSSSNSTPTTPAAAAATEASTTPTPTTSTTTTTTTTTTTSATSSTMTTPTSSSPSLSDGSSNNTSGTSGPVSDGSSNNSASGSSGSSGPVSDGSPSNSTSSSSGSSSSSGPASNSNHKKHKKGKHGKQSMLTGSCKRIYRKRNL